MKIAFITDMDLRGSGYLNLSAPLCNGLVERGHEIKVAGLGYLGQEHWHKFSIIPAQNLQEAHAIILNLNNMWKFDVLIVALDIPLHERFLQLFKGRQFKYIGIMPIEADPLCFSWAMVLMEMNKVFIISEFGTQEAKKAGIDAEHLQIGIDTSSWKQPTEEEREKLRENFGFSEDTFVVLTVADNQERKNLARAMEIFADFSKDKDAKYIMVTREHNRVGWKLRDYAQELGINNNFMIFERGMPFKELWSMYAVSNAFLLPSKAEGLGMPLLEAMAIGLPCLGTNCTAIAEVLGEDRGLLIEPDYVYRDPFGNGKRYLASREDGTKKLELLYAQEFDTIPARNYAENRKWEITIDQLEKALLAATSESINSDPTLYVSNQPITEELVSPGTPDLS